jgi:hypothetical protein
VLIDRSVERAKIRLQRLGIESHESYECTPALRDRQPGGNVRFMIELRAHDDVARLEFTFERAREMPGQRGRIGAEDDPRGVCIDESREAPTHVREQLA